MKGWQPLSRRGADKDEVVPYEGTPAHLLQPLVDWLEFYGNHATLRKVALRVRIRYEPSHTNYPKPRVAGVMVGIKDSADPEKALLDVVEGVLFAHVHADSNTYMQEVAKDCAASLDEILTLGGSHWRVANDHLEARVDDSVRSVVDRALDAAKGTSAATHLRDAWTACYGRNPIRGKAYSEAIKAVESAAAPVVSPKNLKATLGTILGDLRANPGLWRFAIEPSDIDPVISATSALWEGQTDRHGGVQPTKAISALAEEAALPLAATLVQWFSLGAVKRR